MKIVEEKLSSRVDSLVSSFLDKFKSQEDRTNVSFSAPFPVPECFPPRGSAGSNAGQAHAKSLAIASGVGSGSNKEPPQLILPVSSSYSSINDDISFYVHAFNYLARISN